MADTATGCLDVLNIGTGHLKFGFDKNDADEVAKAKKVIADMLKRGYMIFVKVGGEQKRVRAFDPEHDEYILEEPDVIPEPEPLASADPAPRLSRKGRRGPRVPLRRGRATAIGPTAGG